MVHAVRSVRCRLRAQVFSFGVLAYELYVLVGRGVEYYGEGDMFDGGGLMDGLSTIREPIDAGGLPERPDACEIDAVWQLLCECLQADAAKRPTFGAVAVGMSEAQQAAAGAGAGWL